MEKKKPSYIPDAAWSAYQFYSGLPDLTVKGTPVFNSDQKEKIRKENESFFEKLFFSEMAEHLWRGFPKDKDARSFIGNIKLALLDGKKIAEEIKKSKALKKEITPTIKKLGTHLKRLKEALYIVGLDDFLEKTNIFNELKSLNLFINSADIGLSGQTEHDSSVRYAMSFRKRQSDKDFTRCLCDLMYPEFGYDRASRRLVLGALSCFFKAPEKTYDEQFIFKTMILPHSRRKKI